MVQSYFSARPAWSEINLDNLTNNIRQIRQLIGPMTGIMAVVKADGYGHGAVAIARTALKSGASSLAVAFVEEAIDLRRAGIDAPIFLLGYTDPAQFTSLVEYNLTPAIFSLDTAIELSKMAVERGVSLSLHLKVDTGMGRVGLLPEEALEVVSRIIRLPGLRIEGLLTHFASAEAEDHSYTDGQLLLFNRIIDRCREKGISFPTIHAANSAAAIKTPVARYNMIRLGIALYGCYPSPDLKKSGLELLPLLTFKSKIVMVKVVPPGSSISYGCTYRTKNEALIATIPVGYADGYSRLLSNKGKVLIRGQRVPVVGNICMDHFMADVSEIPGVRRGDEVVLYGHQGAEKIMVEEVAGLIGMTHYELLCAVDKRVPRFYFSEGRLSSVHDFLGDLVID